MNENENDGLPAETIEQRTIDAGVRVAAFLDDPAVVGAMQRLNDQYIAEMRSATEPEKVLQTHAKLRALEDIQRQLRATRDAGTVARHEQQQRERRETQRRAK